MSEKISSGVPPVPAFNGNVQQWAQDMTVYLERVLRDHDADIQLLHNIKQDNPEWYEEFKAGRLP